MMKIVGSDNYNENTLYVTIEEKKSREKQIKYLQSIADSLDSVAKFSIEKRELFFDQYSGMPELMELSVNMEEHSKFNIALSKNHDGQQPNEWIFKCDETIQGPHFRRTIDSVIRQMNHTSYNKTNESYTL